MKKLILHSVIACLLFLNGCGKPPVPPPKISLDEANAKFLKTLQETYKYNDVIVKVVGTTLWIYFPVEKDIIEIKASRETTVNDNKASVKPNINYLEGQYTDGVFNFDYDISDTRNYKKSLGYASNYSEEYQRIQQNLLASMQGAYFDNAEKPDFIVLTIADINSGVEMESIFYFEDIKRSMGMLAGLSQEEFLKRYVYELRGSTGILQDKAGAHLNYREIDMPYFLTKQIIGRINFKYQRSSFPPSDDTITEMTNIITETLKTYDFQNFTQIKLHNMQDDSTNTINKTDPIFAEEKTSF